jgi:hypothetical protein
MFNLHQEIDKSDLIEKDKASKLVDFNKFPKCIQQLAKKKYLGHKGRFILLLYLRDQKIYSLSNKQIVSILKSLLSREEWLHASTSKKLPSSSLHPGEHNVGENMLPIKKALQPFSYNVPSCFQLEKIGLCPEKCKRWHPIYK